MRPHTSTHTLTEKMRALGCENARKHTLDFDCEGPPALLSPATTSSPPIAPSTVRAPNGDAFGADLVRETTLV
jgi:hypothetical protein